MDSNLTPSFKPHSATDLAYRALAQSGCGALLTDERGIILYVNPRLCEISGYDNTELVGQNPRVLQSGHTSLETYQSLWQTVTTGKSWHGIMKNRRKNGSFYWEALTVSPIKTEKGEISNYSAIIEDITSERASQAFQTESEKEISRQEKLECLKTMTRGVSHDLNNSLASILIACEIATRNQNDSKKLIEMLELIKDSASCSAEFVRQMNDFWRPIDPSNSLIDLKEIVETDLALYREVAGRYTLNWSPKVKSTLTMGDHDTIRQAIYKLIENSCESSPKQPIVLCCGSIDRLEPEVDEYFMSCGLSDLSVVYLEVTDFGCGMDSYTLRRAFNPFFSRKPGHKGLGLATVHGIMTAHAGAIGVKSEVGKGTRVRLYFRNTQN